MKSIGLRFRGVTSALASKGNYACLQICLHMQNATLYGVPDLHAMLAPQGRFKLEPRPLSAKVRVLSPFLICVRRGTNILRPLLKLRLDEFDSHCHRGRNLAIGLGQRSV